MRRKPQLYCNFPKYELETLASPYFSEVVDRDPNLDFYFENMTWKTWPRHNFRKYELEPRPRNNFHSWDGNSNLAIDFDRYEMENSNFVILSLSSKVCDGHPNFVMNFEVWDITPAHIVNIESMVWKPWPRRYLRKYEMETYSYCKNRQYKMKTLTSS